MVNSWAHEQHYRIPELSKLWGLSKQVTIRLCRDEPGVIKLCKAPGCRVTLSVPASIARVIHNRISESPFQSALASGNPGRVVTLRDGNGSVIQQTRNIFKIHPGNKTPNRKRVT
jgi:hypothetical protein